MTPNPPVLLVSDIDNTLVGSARGAADLCDWLDHEPNVLFCVATGRRLEKALPLLHKAQLPQPTVCITSVGTRIHYRSGSGRGVFRPCRNWPHVLAQGWHREAVRRLLIDFPGLRPQSASEQMPFKLSYVARDAPRLAQRIAARLSTAELDARVVASHQHLLDVLAPNASKAAAVAFLCRFLGIGREQIIVAGDSGNDLDMLIAGHRAIIVANHEPVLARLRGTPGVYFSARPGALGVLDGVCHHQRLADAREST